MLTEAIPAVDFVVFQLDFPNPGVLPFVLLKDVFEGLNV